MSLPNTELSTVVNVVDNATAPLNKITENVQKMADTATEATRKLATAFGSDLDKAVADFEKSFDEKYKSIAKDLDQYEKDSKKAHKGAAEEANKSSNDIDRAFEKQRAAMKEAAASVLRYAAAFVGLRAVYHNITESENATAKLQRTLEGIGAQSGITAAQVSSVGEAIAKSSQYGTTEVKIAAEQLIRFRAVSAQNLEPVLKVTASLAQQMGVDLPQAAQVVSRALLAPSNATRLLRQYGISLTTTQQEQIRTYEKLGQTQKAQAIVLAQLNRLTDGGKLEVRTFSEAITQLKNTISDLTEGPEGGMGKLTEQVKNLNSTLADPSVKEGMNSFFSLMLSLLDKSIQGWSSLFLWIDKVGRTVTGTLTDEQKYLNNVNRVYRIDDEIERLTGIANNKNSPGYAVRAATRNLADLRAERSQLMGDNKKQLDTARAKANSDAAVALYAQIQRSNAPAPTRDVDFTELNKQIAAFKESFISQFGTNDQKVSEQITTWNKKINDAIKDGLITPKEGALMVQRMVKIFTDNLSDLSEVEIKAQKVDPASLGDNAQKRLERELEKDNAGPQKRALMTYREQIAALQVYAEEMRAAGRALDDADIADRARELAEQLNSALTKATEKPKTEFAKRAEQNIQDAIAQFVLNPFKSGLRNLGFNIINTFRQIIAQLVAEKLAENLFKSKTGSKIISGVANFVGSLFGKAGGGNVSPNSITRINEEGTELIATGRNAISVINQRQAAFLNAGNQRSAQPVTYAPVYNVTGVDTQQVLAYIERSRKVDQQNMVRMLARNGLGSMR